MQMIDHAITCTYFDAGAGDAIWIRFLGNDSKWHHVLVDGGYGYAYKMAFGPLIREIVAVGETVDLWLISHIDLDHIGAVLGFIRDKKLKDKEQAVRRFWFNHAPMQIRESNGKLAVKEGVVLRDFLKSSGLLVSAPVIGGSSILNLYGLKITALTPTSAKLAVAGALWQAEEKTGKLGRNAAQSDHRKSITALEDRPFLADADPVNGSSISCLMEYCGLKFLLLADSHPEDVVAALRMLGYSEERPLAAVFMQLAHHGSKGNTSPELLRLVSTDCFVITGNGCANAHPDKESLVRLLTASTRSDKLRFIFPYHTKEITDLFMADIDAAATYNFVCEYPPDGERSVSLNFIPIDHLEHE